MTEGKAVEQLAGLLLANESLDTVLQRVAELAKETVEGADEVSVTLVRDGHATTAAFTGDLALAADERQYELGHGPCLDAGRGNEVLIIDDMLAETRWPDYAPKAAGHGAGSSMSLPLPVVDEVVGALNIYSQTPHTFNADNQGQATRFASFAAVAIANADLYAGVAENAEQMQAAMESRAVIEQAKGVIMAQRRCSAADAFAVLIAASQRENTKLRVLAQRIVDGVVD